MRSLRAARTLTAVVAVLALAACGGGDDQESGGTSQTVALEAFDFRFDPTSLLTDLGSRVTVEFTNNGEVAHSFTAPDLDAELELTSGAEGSVTFTIPNEPGSLDFFCKFHPDDMQGTISIGGGDEPLEEVPETEDDEDVDVDVEDDT